MDGSSELDTDEDLSILQSGGDAIYELRCQVGLPLPHA